MTTTTNTKEVLAELALKAVELLDTVITEPKAIVERLAQFDNEFFNEDHYIRRACELACWDLNHDKALAVPVFLLLKSNKEAILKWSIGVENG